MKLNQFVSDVLKDINDGIEDARKQTGRRYRVQTSDNKGVSFDVAVTAEDTESHTAEGEAKAGFVQVLGAGVSAKLESKQANSEVSRIQFTIYIPSVTEAEEAESSALIQRNNRNQIEDSGFGV